VIRFVVLGLPKPAGSKRGFPYRGKDGKLHVRVADANPQAGAWKQEVALAARAHVGELLLGPLVLRVTFTLPRPAGHFGSGKNAAAVRASAPTAPAVKPDLLKLTRAIEDSLTGVAWRDDAQIVEEHLWKRYAEPGQPASTTVEIDELGASSAYSGSSIEAGKEAVQAAPLFGASLHREGQGG
jgi:Holliday junction resolvase RusA-like endonuclease